MAIRTLISSGSISSGAAFDVVPVSTDDIVIPAGFYLVIDVNKTFNSVTVESLVGDGLTVNAKLTANVIVGNGSAKDGQLTFGQGCEIAGSITFNNCKVRSTATTSAWAKVTGSGSVKSGTDIPARNRILRAAMCPFKILASAFLIYTQRLERRL